MDIVLKPQHVAQLASLEEQVRLLNKQKILVMFEALGIKPHPSDLSKIMAWDLISVSVPDRKLALHLNKLLPYVPNIIFVVDEDDVLFTLKPGVKKRRVRKDR